MIRPLKTVFNKKWIPYKNKVDFYLDGKRTVFDGPMTTVHGFFYDQKKRLLLVEHKKRGWEIPGGHIEAQESFENAMKRELLEEAQMFCSELTQLGYLRKEATEEKPKDCLYPYPISYCLFYMAHIEKAVEFHGDSSIIDFKFVSEQEARTNLWIKAYQEYFEASLKLV